MKLQPRLNEGTYVFISAGDISIIPSDDVISSIREKEGHSVVIEKSKAIAMGFQYNYEAAWITLDVNSDLDLVGMTAKFSDALGREGISCNVIAGFHHDHIFVGSTDAKRAMSILEKISL